mgnify:FL=1
MGEVRDGLTAKLIATDFIPSSVAFLPCIPVCSDCCDKVCAIALSSFVLLERIEGYDGRNRSIRQNVDILDRHIMFNRADLIGKT